ncbi:hypothetical protein [Streptosporangium lutulentum]|uniref:Uncharacterized protein n=1 Tax=Streptosporangium lutulentum TaxID=1461250 RepID=A0ABT9QQ99_9ACTN|nr:hypothetical protein [Streptosporangium lutulentum]MDP9848936.1 hypothetical protein [Streptosporangium lutulentum]
MWIAVAVTGAIIVVCFLIALVVVVISIHVEDGRATITSRAPGAAAARTRRILGLKVDHSTCRKVTNPEHACPLCRRGLQKIIQEDTAGQ